MEGFQMHLLIAIRGEMDEEFTKPTNKQIRQFIFHLLYYIILYFVKGVDIRCWPYDGAVRGLGLSRKPLCPYPPIVGRPLPQGLQLQLLCLTEICRCQEWNPRHFILPFSRCFSLSLYHLLYFDVSIYSISLYTTFFLCRIFSYIVNFNIFQILFHNFYVFSLTYVGATSWIKLHIQMVVAIKGFNRFWLFCKK